MTDFKKPLALLVASLFALAACGGGDAETTETADAAAPEAADAAEAAAPQETADTGPDLLPAPEGSLAGGEMVIGSDEAPLTIVEYASVTCPACAAFHANLFPRIKEEFIDTGKVRFIYKEFPTAPVRRAQAGFILARCAATEAGPNAYFSMVDALYKRQYEWVRGDAPTVLRAIAAQAGIGEQGFEDCFRREDIRNAIVGSIEAGRDAGITGTPTLLIDGERFNYSGDVDETLELIQAEVDKRS